MEYRTYGVRARDKAPLLHFLLTGLEETGCRVLFCSEPSEAPFRVTFETPDGERLGIVAYAFFANSKLTRNRPADECRFQLKYGSRDGLPHPIWQDPYGLYTTLLLGIDPHEGIFVAADPVLHNPTLFFISIEFKRRHMDEILRSGWTSWERERRDQAEPVEVLVGGQRNQLLRLVRFEREAAGEDQGHRQLLAERFQSAQLIVSPPRETGVSMPVVGGGRIHSLAREFELSETEVLDLISSARRLKMAVRGWVAEEHLARTLSHLPGVTECRRLDEEGGPDIRLSLASGRPITMECKNVLRTRTRDGLARLDFQRTRASKEDPCSRYYSSGDFDVVAACLHSVTERWEFCYALTRTLPPHAKCSGKISNNLQINGLWDSDAIQVLQAAHARA